MSSPARPAALKQIWFFLLAVLLLRPHEAGAATAASRVFEQVKDSVVVVKAYDRQGKPVGLGSGVVLPSGEVATNYHVVKEAVRLTVSRGSHTVPAFRYKEEPGRDLCLLQVSGLKATPVRLGRASRLKVGEPVYAIGAPLGLELSLTEGLVSQGLNFAMPVERVIQLAQGKRVKINEEDATGDWAAKKGSKSKRWEESKPPAPFSTSRVFWPAQAKALIEARNWSELLSHCSRRVLTEPDNEMAWLGFGLAYSGLGRHREAVEAFHQTIRLKPDLALAWLDLGISYEKLGYLREAVEAYKEALKLEPELRVAWEFWRLL